MHSTYAARWRLRMMPTLRFTLARAVAVVFAALRLCRMGGAGFGIAAACLAGRRLRCSWLAFGRRHPMVEIY